MAKSGFVAIIGRPNSGKSTLMNRLLGTSLSIVTPKAQTTRDRILGILTETSGQIVFSDTPGIHRAKPHGLNAIMVQRAQEALEAPDLIWYLVDPASCMHHEEVVVELLKETLHTRGRGQGNPPVFLLLNKADLKRPSDPLLWLQSLGTALKNQGIAYERTFYISALKGTGLTELMEASWEKIPEGEPFYPDAEQASDRPLRFFVAEKVREGIFEFLQEEVPYACAVDIEKFEESKKPVRIEAVIYVERESQKGIVIGKGGLKIKEIGQSARKQIEELVGAPVFLGLKVKVSKDWTKNPEMLKRMGYLEPRKKASR